MASKSTSKRTTVTSTMTSSSSASQGATPGASTSFSERPSSPLSPTRVTRLQEKADLQNLNDRLAHYIDLVRSLENDRSRLTRQIQTIEETKTKEIQTFKNIYEHELQEARQLIDDLSREKAKLEIDSKRLFDENLELKERLEKKTKDYVIAEKNVHILEARVSDLGSKYNQAVADRKKALDELKDLEKEYEKLKAQLNELRDKLQHETLLRIDVENALQTLREDLQLKEQIFNEQLTETQTRRQVEISEIDGRLSEQYEERLRESLQELRDQYEAQMRANREEIQYMYETKFKNAMNQAAVNNETITKNAEEMRAMRSRLDSYQSRIGELEASNSALLSRIRDLEKVLEMERMKHMEERAALESDLQRLRDEMDAHLKEYQDLMDIKVALDLEIAVYRKMIESEEARLNITPNQSANVSQQSFRSTPIRRTPLRGGKRKRTTLEESESESRFEESNHAKGDVEISGVCPDGKFVKIHNKGNKEIVLGGWQLVRKAGEMETVFKFHRSVKIEPGTTITVWSADQGQTHEPPNNLVMKSQKWFVADSMTTTLISNAGEEMAVSERKRLQVSHSVSRRQEFSGYPAYRSNMDELYHQQGDPQGEDRCSVM